MTQKPRIMFRDPRTQDTRLYGTVRGNDDGAAVSKAKAFLDRSYRQSVQVWVSGR